MPFLDRFFGKPAYDPYAYDVERERERLHAVQAALDGPYGDNATLFDTTRKLVEAANFPDSTAFAKNVSRAFLDRCEKLREAPPHYDIVIEMVVAAAGLYAAERLRDLPPNPALYGIGADSASLGALRDLLLKQQRKAAYPQATLEAITEVLVDCFLAITRQLPSLARTNPAGDVRSDDATSIPFLDLLQNAGALVEECLKPFASPKAAEIGLFHWLRGKLEANIAIASEQMRSKGSIAPSRFEGSPAQVISAYLADTPLASIFDIRVPFTISITKRLEHTAIIAGSGWGKTQLLQTLIAEDLQLPDPPAMVVIDSTNRMVDRIQHLSLFTHRLKDRILIIDPERSPTPALNMFDLNTPRMAGYNDNLRERVQTDIIALFNYVFSSIQNPLTDPMRTAFSYMVRLLISIPNANITTLRKLLEENPKGGYEASAFKEYIDKLDPTAKDFFRLQFYTERVRGTRYTNYACYVRGMDAAVTLTLPFYTLENMPTMSAAEHAELLERNKARTAQLVPQQANATAPVPGTTPAKHVNQPAAPVQVDDCAKDPMPVPVTAKPLDPGEPADTW